LVTGTNKLYLWNGGGWYQIATINLTPTITGQPAANYELENDGTALTVTPTATDPEGFPLTWSVATTGLGTLATISQSANAFTFTGSTVAGDQGQSFTAVFSASDGTNTAASNTSTFTIEVTVTLVALWKDVNLSSGHSTTNGLGNDTFIDRSSNAFTVTPTELPAQSAFHAYLDNYGIDINATRTDRVIIAPATAINLGTGDCCVECWIKGDLGRNAGYKGLFGNWVSGANMQIQLNNGLITGGTSSGTQISGTTNALDGKWNHIAFARSSGNARIFLNGVQQGVTLTGNTVDFSNNANWQFGDIALNRYMTAIYADIRMVKGACPYTANFTPPTAPLTAITGTGLLTANSNRIVDTSGNATAITFTGTPAVVADNPFGQGSEYAPAANKGSTYFGAGDTSFLSFPTTATNYEFTADFSVEFWYYPTGTSNDTYASIFSLSDASNDGIAMINHSKVIIRDASGTELVNSGTDIMNLYQWNHVVISRSSSAFNIWVNGTSVHSATTTASIWDASITAGFIGKRVSSAGTHYAHGYVSDLRVIKGSATYTSAFTPPTSPVGNSGATLYLPMDNPGSFDKTSTTTFHAPTQAAQGAPLTDTSIKKYAASSMNFGTTSEDKLFQVNGAPALGKYEFTIEFWMYSTSVTGTWQSIITRDYGTAGGWRIYKPSTTAGLTFYQSSSSVLSTGAALTGSTWHHIAVTRDASNNLRIFVDGVIAATKTSFTTDLFANDEAGNPLNIGSGGLGDASAYPFAGNIEGVQILAGTCKYVTGFTVPAAEQGIANQVED
jgi:hypothetical protein